MAIDQYNDIINLPHHVSERHPQLSKASYAAQFSPFAALSGYDGIVSEAARVTDERVELGETDMEILSAKLQNVFLPERLFYFELQDESHVYFTYAIVLFAIP